MAIKNSSQLIVESTLDDDISLMQRKYSSDPLRYCMDAELAEQARNENKPVQSLDQNLYQLEIIPMSSEEASRWSFPSGGFDANPILDVFEKWQKGEETYFLSDNSEDSDLLERNLVWLNEAKLTDLEGKQYTGLVDLLKNSTTEACVAVGTAHLLHASDTTLLKTLERENFVIKRIFNKSPNL